MEQHTTATATKEEEEEEEEEEKEEEEERLLAARHRKTLALSDVILTEFLQTFETTHRQPSGDHVSSVYFQIKEVHGSVVTSAHLLHLYLFPAPLSLSTFSPLDFTTRAAHFGQTLDDKIMRGIMDEVITRMTDKGLVAQLLQCIRLLSLASLQSTDASHLSIVLNLSFKAIGDEQIHARMVDNIRETLRNGSASLLCAYLQLPVYTDSIEARAAWLNHLLRQIEKYPEWLQLRAVNLYDVVKNKYSNLPNLCFEQLFRIIMVYKALLEKGIGEYSTCKLFRAAALKLPFYNSYQSRTFVNRSSVTLQLTAENEIRKWALIMDVLENSTNAAVVFTILEVISSSISSFITIDTVENAIKEYLPRLVPAVLRHMTRPYDIRLVTLAKEKIIMNIQHYDLSRLPHSLIDSIHGDHIARAYKYDSMTTGNSIIKTLCKQRGACLSIAIALPIIEAALTNTQTPWQELEMALRVMDCIASDSDIKHPGNADALVFLQKYLPQVTEYAAQHQNERIKRASSATLAAIAPFFLIE